MHSPVNEVLLSVAHDACKKLRMNHPEHVFVHQSNGEVIEVDISSNDPRDVREVSSPANTQRLLDGAGKAHYGALFFAIRDTGGDPREEWFLADIDARPRLVDGREIKAGFNRVA